MIFTDNLTGLNNSELVAETSFHSIKTGIRRDFMMFKGNFRRKLPVAAAKIVPVREFSAETADLEDKRLLPAARQVKFNDELRINS